MIFVTVGTHEQPFNRLIKAIDKLKSDGLITEPVFIQTGYSTYIPRMCKYKDFISMKEMNFYMQQADTVITHGGPSTFIMALQYNKVPIVVPRLSKFNEHVNDHQLTFCKELVARDFPIQVVINTDTIIEIIDNSRLFHSNKQIHLNNDKFVQHFEKIVSDLLS